MTTTPDQIRYTRQEAAAVCGVSVDTVRRRQRAGAFPAAKLRPDGTWTLTQADRGLADNSVGKVIDTLLRNDVMLVDEVGFAPLDATGTQLLFRFVAAAYERRALGIGSHWAFNDWGRVPTRAHDRRVPARPVAAPRRGHHH
jgi:hypothetical protein